MLKKTYTKTVFLSIALMFALSTNVNADTGTAHIKRGSIVGASSISYWYDSSLTSYGYKGAFTNAFTKWDVLSNGFGFNETSTESGAKVKVYVGSNVLPSNVIARTEYYIYTSFGGVSQVGSDSVTNGSNFEHARIRYDHVNGYNNGFDITETCGHEVGHVLGLNHFEDAPAHAGNHWMTSPTTDLTSPTSVDTDHLREKWGY
ncbi:matrixin family metalloprotease [Paenibacillus sp. FSL L8-0340]|uniref:matrixin family metalloprotease n=1 Tax=Paenibacillus sp. FSL L8-0340 TaxID=2954685 RepID=UPI003159891E